MAKEQSGRRQKPTAGRRAYTPPRLRTIDLSAEETLAVGCKLTDGGNAPGGFTCVSNSCAEPGS